MSMDHIGMKGNAGIWLDSRNRINVRYENFVSAICTVRFDIIRVESEFHIDSFADVPVMRWGVGYCDRAFVEQRIPFAD